MGILRKIQADLIDPRVSLSDILRMAKVLASEIDSEELDLWASKELDGYKNSSELPEYRVLNTYVDGTWTNGFQLIRNHGVLLGLIKDDQLRNHLTKFYVPQGIRTIEEYSKLPEERRFQLAADVTSYVNQQLNEGDGGFIELYYGVGSHNFQQILDTVRNRLLDFVLKLGEKWNPKNDPPEQNEIGQLVSVTIYNHPQGGTMTVFDQRGQHVEYQFNAAGNINIEQIQSLDALEKEIGKLREEIDRAKQLGVVPEQAAVEAQDHLLAASREAASKQPNKSTLLENIGKAKDVLRDISSVAGLVNALIKLAEITTKLIN
jgi:hypothetical protein